MIIRRKNKRNRLLLYLGLAIIAALYLAGLLQTIFTPEPISFNPIVHIQRAMKYGFPKSHFVASLVLEGILAFFVLFGNSESASPDVLGRKFDTSNNRQVYGDAHFETPDEFKDVALVQSQKDAYGTILGQMDDSGKYIINHNMGNKRDNKHIMVVGGSGSGKTFTFSKPYCYQAVKRRESIVITDPDGGLYEDMAGYFQDKGYVVRRFDLKTLEKSDGWDILRCVRQAKDPQIMAQQVANAIITNVTDDSSIFGQGSLSLLKACILRVVLGHDYPEQAKNIASVYAMLQNPAGEDFLNTMFDPNVLTEDEMPCLGGYLTFKQGSPNLRGNVITNLATYLQLFQGELLSQLLSTDDIDLTLPGKQPCAYFCIFPDVESTYKFIVALFFTMFFIELVNYADRSKGRKLPIPVNFLLDEFPSIGRIPDFDKKISTVRKRAINLVMILQNITQLQNLYLDSWQTLIANCSTFISLGINDQATAEMVTKRIGETTIEVQTRQHQEQMAVITKAFNSYSSGEGKRALLSYDELFKVNRDDVIILAQWHNPIYARKYPHTLHPDSKQCRPITLDDIPDFYDKQARTEKRLKEDKYIEYYNKKHPYQDIDRNYADLSEPETKPTLIDKIRDYFRDTLAKFVDVFPDTPDKVELTPAERLERMGDLHDEEIWSAFNLEMNEADFELIEDTDTQQAAPSAVQIASEMPQDDDSLLERMCGAPSASLAEEIPKPTPKPFFAPDFEIPEVPTAKPAPAPIGKVPTKQQTSRTPVRPQQVQQPIILGKPQAKDSMGKGIPVKLPPQKQPPQ